VEDAAQVDTDHGLPRLVAHRGGRGAVLPLDELSVAQDPGVVDEHVDAAPSIRDRRNARLDRRLLGHVDALELCLAARAIDRLDEPGAPGRVHIEAGHAAALAREAQRGGAADPGGGARDDHDSVAQSGVHRFSLPLREHRDPDEAPGRGL
jgi:hypothetical protein